MFSRISIGDATRNKSGGQIYAATRLCPPPYIGHWLDTEEGGLAKCLILLVRPRGFEPLLPP